MGPAQYREALAAIEAHKKAQAISRSIPVGLRAKFHAWMEAHNIDSMSDGAWFYTLEQAGNQFCEDHNITYMDGNDCAHYYLKRREARKERWSDVASIYQFSESDRRALRNQRYAWRKDCRRDFRL